MKAKYIIGGAIVLVVIALASKGGQIEDTLTSMVDSLTSALQNFIPSVEGFSPTPYWDVSRWSWGYGTEAPGQYGTITREQAFSDMLSHLMDDYNTLSAKITVPLNVNQWTALLSFSYNLGVGNAEHLVQYINNGDNDTLGSKWNQYVHAGGVVNSDLVARRQKEWDLWNS